MIMKLQNCIKFTKVKFFPKNITEILKKQHNRITPEFLKDKCAILKPVLDAILTLYPVKCWFKFDYSALSTLMLAQFYFCSTFLWQDNSFLLLQCSHWPADSCCNF